MKSWILLICMMIVCCSGGCARYYYQEGKTFEQCQMACSDCAAELAKRVTNTKPGAYEHKYMEECMKRKGYTTVTEDELPLSVKRKDPDTSLRGLIYGWRRGIAGELKEK